MLIHVKLIFVFARAELAALYGVDNISAYLFASPKPGNEKFSNYFMQLGMRYDLFNCIKKDIVPLSYSALKNVTTQIFTEILALSRTNADNKEVQCITSDAVDTPSLKEAIWL